MFEQYYTILYSKPHSADEDVIRNVLSTLDLPSISEVQNKTQDAISRLKANMGFCFSECDPSL